MSVLFDSLVVIDQIVNSVSTYVRWMLDAPWPACFGVGGYATAVCSRVRRGCVKQFTSLRDFRVDHRQHFRRALMCL
jgi:hypothetical protein